MPGVWLLDETYDYDAASQIFSTQTTTKRLQQSGSAPGIRVTVTANYADLEARAKPRNRHGRRGPKAPSPGERTVDPAESWDFASPRSRTHGSPGAARPNRNFTKLDQSVDAKTQAMLVSLADKEPEGLRFYTSQWDAFRSRRRSELALPCDPQLLRDEQ